MVCIGPGMIKNIFTHRVLLKVQRHKPFLLFALERQVNRLPTRLGAGTLTMFQCIEKFRAHKGVGESIDLRHYRAC